MPNEQKAPEQSKPFTSALPVTLTVGLLNAFAGPNCSWEWGSS